ncbi:MAG: YciI family protein [Adhaeribacter sp.]
MSTDKKYYFLKLNPPRASFVTDMNDDERNIMQAHIAYWTPFVNDGTALVLGPVMDPKGGYGAAVVRVDNEETLAAIVKNDPANGLNTYEVHPMVAVTKY